MHGNSSTLSQTLYAHVETTTISGQSYYLQKSSSSDGPATSLSVSAASTGRKLVGRWVYQLTGVVSIPASTWAVTYRAKTSGSASSVVAHADIDVLIRKNDNTIRTTIATNVANSPPLTLVNTWETLTGTYGWADYAVVDQTDHLEVAYYIEVTTAQNSKSVYLRVDDNSLALADQTKIANIMFTFPNQAPVASFTYSPTDPVIYETVAFNASASYDPDGFIVSYQWNFGDGNITTVTDPIIAHVYKKANSTIIYTVTLTVTDNEGATNSVTQDVSVTNPAILRVSLPAGTYSGVDPDPWLNEGWLLNINAGSGTFTLRVNDTSTSITSYDTHLVIALNSASYSNFVSLSVNGTEIPKSAFQYDKPKPYNMWDWPSGDVYPTWFADTYIIGTINPKAYKDLALSVTLSDATDARIHFDAYGSKDPVPPPPDVVGKITHNPLSGDSTVLFFPPAVAQYYLTTVSPHGTIGGQGWYTSGSTAYATLDTSVVDHGNQTRRVFLYWSGDTSGTNYAQSDPIFMDSNKTAIAVWKTQYYVTVISPYGIVSGEGWYDNSSIIYVSLNTGIVDHGNGTRRVFLYWSGDTSGTNYSQSDLIHVDSPKTIIAVWKTQYYLTVTSPYGTTSGQGWYDKDSTAYADLNTGVVDHGNGTRRVFTSWSGDASGTDYAQSDPILMDGPKTAIAQWKTQYRLTMSTNFGTTDPSVGEHWYDAGEVVSISATAPSVIDDESYVWLGWTGTGTISYTGMDNPASVTMNSPITETAAWRHEYRLRMATNYGTTTPSVGDHWYEAGSDVGISATPPSAGEGERYLWNGWTGIGTVSYTGIDNPATVKMNSPITQTASWVHQFLLTIKTSGLPSAYPSKVYLAALQVGTASDASPYTKWFDAGASTGTIGVDSVVSGATGTRYVFIKWVEDSSTSNPRATEVMNTPKTFTAEYKTQYLLTVRTDPAGLSPQPTRNPAGETGPSSWWYDVSTSVTLTAQSVSEYTFNYWTVDTVSKGSGVNPITVSMNAPHTAIAYYSPTQPPPAVPVGGRSISFVKQTPLSHMATYAVLIDFLSAMLSLIKRKRK